MHKTFISYHHAGEQDLKEAIIRKGVAEESLLTNQYLMGILIQIYQKIQL